MAAPVVWTVGHGASSFADIERLLAVHDIQTIVDVRSAPVSRHATGFDKADLEAACAAAGLHYRFMGSTLGGRMVPESQRAQDDALAELCGVALAARTVVLCAEAAPARCHRSTMLAPLLQDAGFAVVHLLHDGSSLPHQPELPL